MTDRAARAELAALLRALKERSGLSYAELARRTHTTTSTLHRYCTGAGTPADFRVVAALAEATGATDADHVELALLWSRARGAAAPPPAPAPESEPVPAAPRAPWWRRSPAAWLAVAAFLLVGATASVGRAPFPSLSAAPPRTAAADPGGSWTAHPWPVGADALGVTVNSNTGRMPGFGVGSARFWDGGTRWADLEPQRGRYAWAPLDRLVKGARTAGLSTLYTLGGTPAWAAPDGPRSMYADGSRTAPPDDPAEWTRFVAALANRYRGRIGAYELWDTATDRHFWSGGPRALAAMVRSAASVLHRADPHARVVCPSMGRIAERGGSPFLREFAAAGGFAHCDVVAVKVRQLPAKLPPEDITAQLERFERTLHGLDVAAPIWITGPDYDVSTAGALSGAAAADWAVRFYLTMVYGHLDHVERAYFYNWGGRRIPVVLQPEGRPETAAARAVGRLHALLDGARLSGCGHGRAAGLPDHVWRCAFTRVGGARGPAVLAWTDSGTARMPAPYPHTAARRLRDGAVSHPGAALRVDGSPLLLTGGTPEETAASVPF